MVVKLALGLALLNPVKLPSVTTLVPKQPVTEEQEPGTVQLGLGTYGKERQPLLLTVMDGMDPVGIGLLVNKVPFSVPVTPFTVYGGVPPLILKVMVYVAPFAAQIIPVFPIVGMGFTVIVSVVVLAH